MKRKRYLVDDSVYPIYITTMITEWTPVFGESSIAIGSLSLLEKIRAEMNVRVHAFVLMPHHFHAIVRTPQKGYLSILMRKWKSLTARYIVDNLSKSNSPWLDVFESNAHLFKRQKVEKYQVWKPRFDDFGIRTPDQFRTKLNYIHENPIRAGIAQRFEDYPYSSVHDYLGRSNGFVKVECLMAI